MAKIVYSSIYGLGVCNQYPDLLRMRVTQKAFQLPFFVFFSFFSSFSSLPLFLFFFAAASLDKLTKVFYWCSFRCSCKHVWPVHDVPHGRTGKQRCLRSKISCVRALRPVFSMLIFQLLLIFTHVRIFQLIRIWISITMRTAR